MKTRLKQTLLFIFLILMAIGFTVPGFLDFGDSSSPSPARPCQSDADCYLMCDEVPLAVLCYQNLCQQNACTETSAFPYESSPKTAGLEIVINGTKLNLKEQAEKLNLNNFFVKFQEDSFAFFSSSLTLNQVLDKLRMKLTSSCLAREEALYCRDDKSELEIFINQNQSYSYGEYNIQPNDQIKITYLKTL